jgi:uncharacterized protein (TIGR04255 family)
VSYSNTHLVEVNCGFQFPEETVLWDSTFFGQFYEQIKHHGFDQREERKGVQITFNGALIHAEKEPIATSQLEDQVIFKNNFKHQAILLGKNKISFHVVNDYKGWEDFRDHVISPYSEIYKSLGLGNGKRQCSIVYLNRFTKDSSDDLSHYFKLISHLEPKIGKEIMTFVQRVISNENNILIAKLSSQLSDKIQNINLECGAVCTNEQIMNVEDWMYQANETHEPISGFFEEIITNKLRQEL